MFVHPLLPEYTNVFSLAVCTILKPFHNSFFSHANCGASIFYLNSSGFFKLYTNNSSIHLKSTMYYWSVQQETHGGEKTACNSVMSKSTKSYELSSAGDKSPLNTQLFCMIPHSAKIIPFFRWEFCLVCTKLLDIQLLQS